MEDIRRDGDRGQQFFERARTEDTEGTEILAGCTGGEFIPVAIRMSLKRTRMVGATIAISAG